MVGLGVVLRNAGLGGFFSRAQPNVPGYDAPAEAVAAYLYQPTWITVANARVKGLWKDVPLFVNDLSAMSW